MSRYDYNFFEYFANLERKLKAQPLNLGGIIGSGYWGGPPGGFIGRLPQDRVTYDTAEAEISGFVAPSAYVSGILVNASLVDNLNHIRYRIATLEEGYGVDIYEGDNLIASNVYVLDFRGADLVDVGEGEIQITVSGQVVNHVIGFCIPGTLSGWAGESIPTRMLAPWNGIIDEVTINVSEDGYPEGQAIIVDVNLNGTTIFSTQANRPTIPDSGTEDLSAIPDIIDFDKNDSFTCDIDQIGTTLPGSDLVVQVRCKEI